MQDARIAFLNAFCKQRLVVQQQLRESGVKSEAIHSGLSVLRARPRARLGQVHRPRSNGCIVTAPSWSQIQLAPAPA